jgi:DNA-binding CsgD family transcriptional regulator
MCHGGDLVHRVLSPCARRPFCKGEGSGALHDFDGESGDRQEQQASNARAPTLVGDRVEQFVAHVVAAQPSPQPFNGFVELSDVLLDIEVEGVRCIVLKGQPPRPPTPALTARELEIARMVAHGLPNKTIASVLQISTWTVSSHLRRMFAKLGVATRAEMIGRLLEEGKFGPTELHPSTEDGTFA